MSRRKKIDPGSATAGEHLSELRARLFTVLAVFVAVFAVAAAKGNDITGIVASIGRGAGYRIVYIAPQEILIQQLRVAALAAAFVTFPLAFYETMAFVMPAFDRKPPVMRIMLFFLLGAAMFLLGAAFACRILLPFAFGYFSEIGQAAGIPGQVSYGEYVSFVITVAGAVSLSFEFPVACILLCRAGLVKAQGLAKARPFVIVGAFILGALITPPDIFTQCMVAVPMCLLYEASIAVCRIMDAGKGKKKTEKAAEGI